MASFPKVATDFDQIIQADRQRRKNEELAKEIFGRSKQKDIKKRDDKRPGRTSTPSLASRVGIAKRSSSTSSNNPSPKLQSKPRSSLSGQSARANRLADELNNDTSTNIVPPQQPIPEVVTSSSGSGISIKGASGPFVLHASNFAPGTTAADIESALHPDTLYSNGISSLVSCKIVNTKPEVVAELVFTEKVVAESIISKYNGQKADGRILQLELVRSGVGSMSKAHNLSQPAQRQDRRERQPKQIQQQPQQQIIPEPQPEIKPEIEMVVDDAMEDLEVEAEVLPNTNFNDEREAADRDRRDRDSRRDRERDEDYDGKRRGDEDRRRNDRDRDRGERERDRDREHERREERVREERRGIMSSHYGNGVGGGPRGGFGGGGYGGGSSNFRGGRYGDGYGGAVRGGGYRGGYRGYR